jgi:hypothetical protein
MFTKRCEHVKENKRSKDILRVNRPSGLVESFRVLTTFRDNNEGVFVISLIINKTFLDKRVFSSREGF